MIVRYVFISDHLSGNALQTVSLKTTKATLNSVRTRLLESQGMHSIRAMKVSMQLTILLFTMTKEQSKVLLIMIDVATYENLAPQTVGIICSW